MKKFNINYAIPGMPTTLPLFEHIEAEDRDDAKEKFKALHPDWILYHIEEIN